MYIVSCVLNDVDCMFVDGFNFGYVLINVFEVVLVIYFGWVDLECLFENYFMVCKYIMLEIIEDVFIICLVVMI